LACEATSIAARANVPDGFVKAISGFELLHPIGALCTRGGFAFAGAARWPGAFVWVSRSVGGIGRFGSAELALSAYDGKFV